MIELVAFLLALVVVLASLAGLVLAAHVAHHVASDLAGFHEKGVGSSAGAPTGSREGAGSAGDLAGEAPSRVDSGKEVVHLAGEFAPESGQHCVKCGLELVHGAGDSRVVYESPGGYKPRGWAEGALVVCSGSTIRFWADVSEDPSYATATCAVEEDVEFSPESAAEVATRSEGCEAHYLTVDQSLRLLEEHPGVRMCGFCRQQVSKRLGGEE